jgi:hypothetical protein
VSDLKRVFSRLLEGVALDEESDRSPAMEAYALGREHGSRSPGGVDLRKIDKLTDSGVVDDVSLEDEDSWHAFLIGYILAASSPEVARVAKVVLSRRPK